MHWQLVGLEYHGSHSLDVPKQLRMGQLAKLISW